MNITNVTVTKVAEESTENADYQLEYSIVNDALTRVHASIRKKDTDGSGNAPQIGIIYMEQGVISCNIPMGEPLDAKARANPTRCCIPPESCPTI